ncbi:hypothetical protein MAR_008467 [Mya arenaria]|uniref:Uncharacterized protein n=1 Tax=Mya arenaria TaxID=6604 RepID=A0ABY7E0H1_MYAAR|nr:hypothetical protein MAR_008467 [Mya arenaria]
MHISPLDYHKLGFFLKQMLLFRLQWVLQNKFSVERSLGDVSFADSMTLLLELPTEIISLSYRLNAELISLFGTVF